jgi:hypothetical protein
MFGRGVLIPREQNSECRALHRNCVVVAVFANYIQYVLKICSQLTIFN